jgi:FkbM family methyltransferase
MRRLVDRFVFRDYPISKCSVSGLSDFLMRTHLLRDDFISANIRNNGIWEPFETKIVTSILKPGQVFYDLGANIGWYSVVAALCVGERGQVVSFEPSAENFRLLESNLRLNNISGVRASRSAISNYDGQGALYKCDSNRGDHQTDAPDPSRVAEKIMVRSLGAVMHEETAPDMIKLDTQGSEAKILEGLLRSGPKETLTLLVEYWPHGLARTGSTGSNWSKLSGDLVGGYF